MNRLNDILEQQQVPEMALVVYRNNKTESVYIESHRINEKGRMLAGRPLTLKCITELVESLSVEQGNTPHGRIPGNMLYCDTRKGHERYVWYSPPGKRMMFFREDLNIKDGEYRLPGILYDTDGENLNIYAFKGKKPEAGSLLYKAPPVQCYRRKGMSWKCENRFSGQSHFRRLYPVLGKKSSG